MTGHTPPVSQHHRTGVQKKEKTKKAHTEFKDTLRRSEEPGSHSKPNKFQTFAKMNRERIRDENPGLSPKDVQKKVSEVWKSMSTAEKDQYKQETHHVKDPENFL